MTNTIAKNEYLHDYTLVVIDVETSGLCPRTHSLLEVALVPVDNGGNFSWSSYVVPDFADLEWQPVAREMFDPSFVGWVHDAKPYSEAFDRLNAWTKPKAKPIMLIGHNVGFDISFLKQLSRGGDLPANVSHRSIDTHTLAMAVYAREGKPMPNGLTALLADNNIPVPEGDRHTATGDALATRSLYLRLMERLEGRATEPHRF